MGCFQALRLTRAVSCAVSVVSDSSRPHGLYSPPGSSVRGIFQARILEWVATPTPGDLPDPGIQAVSLTSPALAGGFFTTAPSGKALELSC